MNKILFLVPDLRKPGGVANYYSVLKPFLYNNNAYYFVRGSRLNQNYISKLFTFPYDLLRFFFKILLNKYSKTVINNSFASSGFYRDALFISLLRLLNKDFIIFYRGWDTKHELEVSKGLKKHIFKHTFLSADKIIVLANNFKQFIKEQGYKGSLFIETTVVDNKLVEGISKKNNYNNSLLSKKNVLFLSRVEKNKGIFEAIETIKLLNEKGYKFKLSVAGNGGALKDVKEFVKINKLDFVEFLGYVSSSSKRSAFINADYYLFPSTHGEGMPNSVLEAMCFGLPVIANKTGGLADFFAPKMGYLSNTVDPKEYYRYIEYLLLNPEVYSSISIFNHKYAKKNFLAPVVSKRLLKIIL